MVRASLARPTLRAVNKFGVFGAVEWLRFCGQLPPRFLSRKYGFCPEGTTGLSPGLTPGHIDNRAPPGLSAVVLGIRDEGGKGGRNSSRIWFGIHGEKRFSTAAFRAGALSIRTRG